MDELVRNCPVCKEQKELFNLLDTHECCGVEEIYADMLKLCFSIEVTAESCMQELCESCILQLREAHYFKQKVLQSLEDLENQAHANQQMNVEDTQIDRKYEILDEIKIECTLNPQTGQMEYIMNPSEINSYSPKIEENSDNFVVEYNNMDSNSTDIKIHAFSPKITTKEPKDNFICTVCNKDYCNATRLKRHMVTHLEGSFPCGYCDQTFSKMNSRYAHQWRVHQTRAAYVCAHCGERFTTFHKRLRHLQEIHGETEPRYPCPFCDRKYFYAGARSSHIRETHKRERNHKCTICTSAFYKKGDLLGHMASAHNIGDLKHQCAMCNKRFYRENTLKYHLRRHFNCRYKCEKCGAGFHKEVALKCHLKIHELERASNVAEPANVGVLNIPKIDENRVIVCSEINALK